MSPQSTREKMRRAVKRAVKDVEKCEANLKTLDTIANGRLDSVNLVLPATIQASLLIRSVLNKLLKEL